MLKIKYKNFLLKVALRATLTSLSGLRLEKNLDSELKLAIQKEKVYI